MRRRLRLPLLAAALLLGIAALLLSLAEGPRPAQARAEPSFPRWLRQGEVERVRARRTLPVSMPPAPAPAWASGDEPEPPRVRDPFLLALPRDPGKALVVLEANALRHSRLGELFVECVMRKEGRDPFEEARREAGIDPLKDIDRVAYTPDGIILFGFLDRARLDAIPSRVLSRGEHGRIYVPDAEDPPTFTLGTWRGQIIALGKPDFVESTLDRLDGSTAEDRVLIPEYLTYGEAYGVVPGAALQGLFRGEQAELGARIARAASRIELHADAMRDVAVVARFSGADEAATEDLGTALGGALALGRVQAAVSGNASLAELLEHARVVRGAGGFSLELALPIEVVERWFSGCAGPGSPPAGP
ncbi:MAG TPA: hypothetical protein VIV57_26800 [Anaeromyxobacter sp.]